MKFSRIQELSALIPEDSEYFDFTSHVGENEHTRDIAKFATCYKDLAFCWHFIKSYQGRNKDIVVQEDYMTRAYNYLYRNVRDPELEQAIAYDSILDPFYKNSIKSMLFVEGISIDVIAKKLGVAKNIIYLYEKLFFNILDRKDEHMFIASLVYPESRMEELDPRYLEKVNWSSVARRSAYNNGAAEAMAVIGFKNTHIMEGSAEDNSVRLEGAIMANAYFLVKNGFANSRTAVGLSNAKNLIAAAKHGGNEDQGQEIGVGVASLGSILQAEVLKYQEPMIQRRLDYEKEINERALLDAKIDT